SVLVQTSWSTWDNGYIADSVDRFPDRFIGHGMLDPQDEQGNAEAARYWMEDRGLVGPSRGAEPREILFDVEG
ncbi:MAG: hypothetical protein CMO43_01535, partial [Verrucomicrobiales bacterium]|nr:hypothetical protein [Verrucomicrobiales bacterium]